MGNICLEMQCPDSTQSQARSDNWKAAWTELQSPALDSISTKGINRSFCCQNIRLVTGANNWVVWQVIDNEICYKWSEYQNVRQIFHTRFDMHCQIYGHRWAITSELSSKRGWEMPSFSATGKCLSSILKIESGNSLLTCNTEQEIFLLKYASSLLQESQSYRFYGGRRVASRKPCTKHHRQSMGP